MLQDLPVKPKNLLALAVGIKQNASVNAIIQKVSQSQFPKWNPFSHVIDPGIDLWSLLRADEISGKVVLASYYPMCCSSGH